MWFSECKHKQWTPVDDRGYQYCKKCGRASEVLQTCFHQWIELERNKIIRSDTKSFMGYKILMKCSKCGILRSYSHNVC